MEDKLKRDKAAFTMRTILFSMRMIQEKYYVTPDGRAGRTYRRMNPYNPLTYLYLAFGVVIAIVCYGILGAWDAVFGKRNPFKWY